jgi:hypothetical protein
VDVGKWSRVVGSGSDAGRENQDGDVVFAENHGLGKWLARHEGLPRPISDTLVMLQYFRD